MFEKIITILNQIVWGPVSLVLISFVGILITVKLNFFQFRYFFLMLKETVGSVFIKKKKEEEKKGVSPIQAVSTALAGTIGTGSITGVALALRMGGPGVIFWMCVFSLFGMAVKFSEIVLSLKFRERNQDGAWVGGPMYYIKKGLKFKTPATVFTVFALFCCFGIGNLTQSNTISQVFKSTVNFPNAFCGIVLMVLVAIVVLGGAKRIGQINEFLVPFMTIIYILTSFIILFLRFDRIGYAVKIIIQSAFSFKASVGGALGFGFYKAIQFGISRSIFSNEAGLGSAPIAHAASSEKDPVKQGLWGIFEVFFSTVVICTLSGLVILTSDAFGCESITGSELVLKAFDSAIPFLGSWVVLFATIFFAFSSILGWAYYGEVCALYLTKNRKRAVLYFRIIYILFVFLGCIMELDLVWKISETLNGLMAIPNLIAVVCLSGIVKKESDFFRKRRICIEK